MALSPDYAPCFSARVNGSLKLRADYCCCGFELLLFVSLKLLFESTLELRDGLLCVED